MKHTSGTLKAVVLLLVLILLSAPSKGLLLADTFTDSRIQVGLKLFRTLVSADLNIVDKTNNDRELPITLVYVSNSSEAHDFQQTLQASFKSVKDIQVRIDVRALSQLVQNTDRKPAAIFITQPLNEAELTALVKYSIEQHIILFSPFEGDVEKGVLGGLSVQATVRPLINMRTLRSSRIQIKPFYLKVARQYE
jgi:hypothetical protein